MSNPNPPAQPDNPPVETPAVPAPVQTFPPGGSPLNPALIGNVALLGAYFLGAICLIGAIVLAIVHDGSYTQAAFDLFRDVLLIVAGGGSVTGVAHVLRNKQLGGGS